jgi:DNA-damage-inducible protein D
MNNIKLFENQQVRSHWDATTEQWYFSVVDIIQVLTDSSVPKRYWSDLKKKLTLQGSQLYEKIVQLKFKAADGKNYATDCLNTQDLLRLIQAVPSPKAEPFKQWLAKVGYERMQEINDPAMSLDRARENWQTLGRSEQWIQQRMMGQETRNKLTDYWKEAGVNQPNEFALLTNIIHQEWTGLKVAEHKSLKGLKTQNLRDHMSEAELIFTALAELSTRQIADSDAATGLAENKLASKKGGNIAKNARLELEAKTGKNVVTGENFLPPVTVTAKIKE